MLRYLFNINIILLCFFLPVYAQYYHPFQNYDDDVDRIKTYSNFFGGDHGSIHGNPNSPQIITIYDTTETRTAFGRSLRIDYGPLTFWSTYVESFKQQWWIPETSLELTDLFPDYTDSEFQGRHIDSLVFYGKLAAANPLTLKLELHDASDQSSVYSFEINPSVEWQRIAVALNQFVGGFDPSIAKYLGLTFADFPNNQNESGILHVDDFYLVENDYSKPVFLNDLEMLEYLNEVNFRHFWMAVEPVSKFALDRHIWRDLISIDAIGFQLVSYVVAHRRGWIDPLLIEARVEHILDYLLHHCAHATDTLQVKANPLGYATVNGNWAHFLDYNTLKRKDTQTEFSLFSNALLLSGALVCQAYFTSNTNIVNWVDSLYRMTDWNFLYRPQDSLMYYSWAPETGFSQYYSDWFSEELDLAFLLGISTPDSGHRLPSNPFVSPGYTKPYCPTGAYVYSAPGANFTYYFLQMYAKFSVDSKVAIPRFENARYALLADVAFSRQAYSYLNYDPRIFGTTACEGPDSAGVDSIGNNISNYHAYGYPCRHDNVNIPNGTVAVYGSGAATLFIPNEAISCLSYYYNELDTIFINNYGYNFWSPIFGFPDAFHQAPDSSNDPSVNVLNFRGPWLSVPRFGIDIGPMLMNIDSYISDLRSEVSIRDLFSQHPYIVNNLTKFDPIISEDVEFELNEGWNLISWNVATGNDSIEVLLADIMDKVLIVLGFDGEGLTYNPDMPEFNTLHEMDHLHGYWIKMSAPDTLQISGTSVDPQTPIELESGYNLVSCLPNNPDSIEHVLESIFDNLEVVLGFNGGGQTYRPDLPEFSNLHILSPNFGYWIKVSDIDTLIYPESQTIGKLTRILAKRKGKLLPNATVIPTTEWINLYGKDIQVDNRLLPVGMKITALDQDGVVCGTTVVDKSGHFGFMPIYRDDPTTKTDEGATPGEVVSIYFGDYRVPVEIHWQSFGEVINFGEMAEGIELRSQNIPETYALFQNYPNPFNPTTKIRYNLPRSNKVSLIIYDILGREVIRLLDGEKPAGYHHVIWDGINQQGHSVASGIYFYQIVAEGVKKKEKFLMTKKTLLLK